MTDQHIIATPPPGKIEVTVGGQLIDITELGTILTTAGESIMSCFGTTDNAAEYRRRAEAAEAKLAQLADLVNYHGSMSRFAGRDVVILDWAHLTKIMNGTHDAWLVTSDDGRNHLRHPDLSPRHGCSRPAAEETSPT